MAKTIKVRCNGAGKHVNNVDLEAATAPTVVLRGASVNKERLVRPCRFCTEGKVIIERAVIAENLPPAQS